MPNPPVHIAILQHPNLKCNLANRNPAGAHYPQRDSEGRLLETEFGRCKYRDNQLISIQELPETAPPGQLPHSSGWIQCIVLGTRVLGCGFGTTCFVLCACCSDVQAFGSGCGASGVLGSTYRDNQLISIQELPETAPPGQLPHSSGWCLWLDARHCAICAHCEASFMQRGVFAAPRCSMSSSLLRWSGLASPRRSSWRGAVYNAQHGPFPQQLPTARYERHQHRCRQSCCNVPRTCQHLRA